MSTHASKRLKLTFALSAMLLLLLSAIIWLERPRQTREAINNESIERIVIKRAGHDDIELRYSQNNWLMAKPYSLLANKQRIEPLITLGTAQIDGYEKTDVDLPATGLNQPGASVLIGTREILLGNPDIDGDRRYAMVDDKVSLLPEWVWSLLHGGVTAFADLNVFTSLPDELYLINDDNVQRVLNVDQWRALQADKISPAPSIDQTAEPDTISWQLNQTASGDSAGRLAVIRQLQENTLIQTESGFAFTVSNTRADALLAN